jgi:hypothetical protein
MKTANKNIKIIPQFIHRKTPINNGEKSTNY